MHCETFPNDIAHNSTQTGAGPSERLVLTPRADVREDANHIILIADLPGVALADVDISLEQNLLTITGKQAAAQTAANNDGYKLTYSEHEPCDFHRAFRVETAIERDKITASMQQGVLRVTLPKAAPAKISKIDIAVS